MWFSFGKRIPQMGSKVSGEKISLEDYEEIFSYFQICIVCGAYEQYGCLLEKKIPNWSSKSTGNNFVQLPRKLFTFRIIYILCHSQIMSANGKRVIKTSFLDLKERILFDYNDVFFSRFLVST